MLEVVINILAEGMFFKGRELVDTAMREDSVRFEVDSMIPRLMFGESVGGSFQEDQIVFVKGGRDGGHRRHRCIFSSKGGGVGSL